MKTQLDQIPREVAIALLTSNQAQSNTFRKVCKRATERIAEPQSRSTALSVSAPKTYGQLLIQKLRRMNAKQLHQWAKRTLRRGNRLQDLLFGCVQDDAEAFKALTQQIEQLDTLGQAIKSELDTRANRGKLQHEN